MSDIDNEMDEFAKRTLDPLRQETPQLDPQVATRIKMQYMQQAEALKAALPSSHIAGRRSTARRGGLAGFFLQHPLFKFLAAGLVAIILLLAGSSFTVSAAQGSLPGEALYPIKSWSENVRLDLASSPQTRLNLILKFTNRRMDEISLLVADGKTVDEGVSNHFQQELDDALQLAAQLDDAQIQNALLSIKDHAQNQGMTMESLISNLPPQADPAIHRLQDRLSEQVQISALGETDPKQFRLTVRERQLQQEENKHSKHTEEPNLVSPEESTTPKANQENPNPGGNMNQPTEEPGHGGPGNGQGEQQPGNGNHGQNPTHTPKP
jgi:hypothetical protein